MPNVVGSMPSVPHQPDTSPALIGRSESLDDQRSGEGRGCPVRVSQDKLHGESGTAVDLHSQLLRDDVRRPRESTGGSHRHYTNAGCRLERVV